MNYTTFEKFVGRIRPTNFTKPTTLSIHSNSINRRSNLVLFHSHHPIGTTTKIGKTTRKTITIDKYPSHTFIETFHYICEGVSEVTCFSSFVFGVVCNFTPFLRFLLYGCGFRLSFSSIRIQRTVEYGKKIIIIKEQQRPCACVYMCVVNFS